MLEAQPRPTSGLGSACSLVVLEGEPGALDAPTVIWRPIEETGAIATLDWRRGGPRRVASHGVDGFAASMQMRKRAHSPGFDSATISPPCRRTICRTMKSPSPLPRRPPTCSTS